MYAHLILSKIYSLMGLSFLCPLLDYNPPCTPPRPIPFFYGLVPTPDPKAGHLFHDCVQTLDMTLNPFEHITDQSLTYPTVPSWFIDSSAQKQAPLGAGYTIVQGQPEKVIPPHLIKSATLPAHTSSQQAELIALNASFDPSQRPKGKHLH